MDQNKIKNFTSTYFKSDQLYHILKIDGVEFCLLCKERVDLWPIEFSDPLTDHLNSTLHKEQIKSLFELCNPDPLCNSSYEICVDIVNKSVFDISVLLEDESCYIYKKEGNFFCALCQKNIVHIFKRIEVVEYEIFSHIKQKTHIEKIKEVCWVYPLNKDKDFILFHKTVVHCSVCKNIVHCKENTILQTVVYHLQSDQHKYLTSKNNATTDENFAINVNTMLNVEESSDLIKEKEYHILKYTPDGETVKSEKFEKKYDQDYIKSEVYNNCDQRDWVELGISVNKDADDEPNYSKLLNRDSQPNLNKITTDKWKQLNERETEAHVFDEPGREVDDLKDTEQVQLQHELDTLKKSVDLSLGEKSRSQMLEVAGITCSTGNNINKEYMVTNYGLSYCMLCWQDIKYSENHNALTNKFLKHFNTEHHKTNEKLLIKNPKEIEKRTEKNKKRILKKLAFYTEIAKLKSSTRFQKRQNQLEKLEKKMKERKLSLEEKKKFFRLRRIQSTKFQNQQKQNLLKKLVKELREMKVSWKKNKKWHSKKSKKEDLLQSITNNGDKNKNLHSKKPKKGNNQNITNN